MPSNKTYRPWVSPIEEQWHGVEQTGKNSLGRPRPAQGYSVQEEEDDELNRFLKNYLSKLL